MHQFHFIFGSALTPGSKCCTYNIPHDLCDQHSQHDSNFLPSLKAEFIQKSSRQIYCQTGFFSNWAWNVSSCTNVNPKSANITSDSMMRIVAISEHVTPSHLSHRSGKLFALHKGGVSLERMTIGNMRERKFPAPLLEKTHTTCLWKKSGTVAKV